MDCDESPRACGDSVKFSNGREIKRKRIKQVSVFQFRQMQPSLQFVLRAFSSRSLLNTHTITRLRVQHKYAYLKMHLTKRHRVWVCRISGFCWYGDSLGGISTGLSVGMGLKSNPNGSPDKSG